MYAFCRISSSAGKNNSCSLDYQEAEIRKVVDVLGYTIKKVIKCVGSAYSQIPPSLKALASNVGSKIIFYSVDRFCRNVDNGLLLASDFIKNKNQLYFIREKLIVKSTTGQKWADLKRYLKYAEVESNNISNRIIHAKKHLNGLGYFTGGTAPFGHEKHRLANGRIVLEETKENKLIGKFIDLCRTAGTSVVDINRALDQLFAYYQKESNEYPILLNDGLDDHLKKPLDYSNIANLLMVYKLGQRTWTPALISKIHRTFTLKNNKDTVILNGSGEQIDVRVVEGASRTKRI